MEVHAGQRSNGPCPRVGGSDGGRGAFSKPIFGNFARYYHIRNPASARNEADEGPAGDAYVASATSLTSKVDPRVAPMLAFLERHFQIDKRAADAAASRLPSRILDIGCNSGKVMLEMAQQVAATWSRSGEARAPELVLGVDLDPRLIEEARYSVSLAWSKCRPPRKTGEALESSSRSADSRDPQSSDYFPACFPHLYGHLPLPVLYDGRQRGSQGKPPPRSIKRRRLSASSEDTGDRQEPPSISSPTTRAFGSLQFLAMEWVNADLEATRTSRTGLTRSAKPSAGAHSARAREVDAAVEVASKIDSGRPSTAADVGSLLDLERHDRDGYEVILCLALTKWIHVHHGDRGMMRLFARIVRSLRPGGCLLLERQPWKSYEEARRMGPETRAKMSGLQLRPEGDFEWILEGLGLVSEGRVGDGPGMGFVRHIDAFVKPLKPLTVLADQMADTFLGFRTQAVSPEGSPDGIPWVARYPRRGPREQEDEEKHFSNRGTEGHDMDGSEGLK